MKKSKYVPKSIIFFFILSSFISFGQNEKKDAFKIVQPGMEFGMLYMNPRDLNAVFNSWLSSLGYDIVEGFSGGIHVGLSGAGFVALRPLKFLEIRPLYGVMYAPYLMFSSDGQKFNINILSHGPGISGGVIAGKFRMGVGFTRNFSTIQWNDLVFDNDDHWKGKSSGYHLYIGFNSDPKEKLRYTISIEYQNNLTSQLLDSDKQVVTKWESTEKLTLNLSGFTLKFGYYF